MDQSSLDAVAEERAQRDRHWMKLALAQARSAELAGEVPVGAVLVSNEQLLASAANRPIGLDDPTAHAEVSVLRAAGRLMGNYRLPGTTLYVTLEPCAMCTGAIIHARVARLVYAADDPRTGAVRSALELLQSGIHNHFVEYTAGVLADESAELLRQFFRGRRGR